MDSSRTPEPAARAAVVLPPANLPPGSLLQPIAFTTEPAGGRAVVHEWAEPQVRRAVVLEGSEAGDLQLLSVPVPAGELEEAALLARLGEWMEAGGAAGATLWLTLPAAQVFWRPGRAVVLAPPDRLDLARRALVEFAWVAGELRELEGQVGQGWKGLEQDTPLAFSFQDKAMARREAGR